VLSPHCLSEDICVFLGKVSYEFDSITKIEFKSKLEHFQYTIIQVRINTRLLTHKATHFL